MEPEIKAFKEFSTRSQQQKLESEVMFSNSLKKNATMTKTQVAALVD